MSEPTTAAGRALLSGIAVIEGPHTQTDPDAQPTIDYWSEHIAAIEAEARAAADSALAAEKERVARLREAFTAYGQHQQPCAFGPTVRCTCGYIDTLRSLTLGAG